MKTHEILSLSVSEFLDLYGRIHSNFVDTSIAQVKSMGDFLAQKGLLEEYRDYWGDSGKENRYALHKLLIEIKEFKILTRLYMENLKEK